MVTTWGNYNIIRTYVLSAGRCRVHERLVRNCHSCAGRNPGEWMPAVVYPHVGGGEHDNLFVDPSMQNNCTTLPVENTAARLETRPVETRQLERETC